MGYFYFWIFLVFKSNLTYNLSFYWIESLFIKHKRDVLLNFSFYPGTTLTTPSCKPNISSIFLQQYARGVLPSSSTTFKLGETAPKRHLHIIA